MFIALISSLAHAGDCVGTAEFIGANSLPAQTVAEELVAYGSAEVAEGTSVRESVRLPAGKVTLAAVPCPLTRALRIELRRGDTVVCSAVEREDPAGAVYLDRYGEVAVDFAAWPMAQTSCQLSGGSYTVVVTVLDGDPGSSAAWFALR